jgi:hypothetical protein
LRPSRSDRKRAADAHPVGTTLFQADSGGWRLATQTTCASIVLEAFLASIVGVRQLPPQSGLGTGLSAKVCDRLDPTSVPPRARCPRRARRDPPRTAGRLRTAARAVDVNARAIAPNTDGRLKMSSETFVACDYRVAVKSWRPIKISEHLPEESETLRRLGIVTVNMTYDGRFGERQVSHLEFKSLDTHVSVVPAPPLSEAIATFLRELLELRFPGWEVAEGARGYFEWDVLEGALDHCHALRVLAYGTLSSTVD